MRKKKPLPPTYFNISVALIVLLHFVFPVKEFIQFPINLLGLIPAAIGVILNLKTDKLFKKYETTVKPFEESNYLMTCGTFRISRNPMYLGMGLILLGLSIFLGSVSPFIITVVFLFLMEFIFIRVEESMLAEKFGDEWLEYCKSVRRWI